MLRSGFGKLEQKVLLQVRLELDLKDRYSQGHSDEGGVTSVMKASTYLLPVVQDECKWVKE